MKFAPGDICVNDPNGAAGAFLITHVFPGMEHPYRGVELTKKKNYKLKEDMLVKIGHLMSDLSVEEAMGKVMATPGLPGLDSPEYLRGKSRAEYEAQHGDPAWRPHWQILAQAKPGDAIPVHIEEKPGAVTFHHVIDRGEKFVFAAVDRKGKVYRYPIEAICLRDTPGVEHGH